MAYAPVSKIFVMIVAGFGMLGCASSRRRESDWKTNKGFEDVLKRNLKGHISRMKSNKSGGE